MKSLRTVVLWLAVSPISALTGLALDKLVQNQVDEAAADLAAASQTAAAGVVLTGLLQPASRKPGRTAR